MRGSARLSFGAGAVFYRRLVFQSGQFSLGWREIGRSNEKSGRRSGRYTVVPQIQIGLATRTTRGTDHPFDYSLRLTHGSYLDGDAIFQTSRLHYPPDR